MVVGAGTVLTVDQAQVAAGAGALDPVAGDDDGLVDRLRSARNALLPGHHDSLRAGSCPSARMQHGQGLPRRHPRCGTTFLRAVSATFPQARFLPTRRDRRRCVAGYLPGARRRCLRRRLGSATPRWSPAAPISAGSSAAHEPQWPKVHVENRRSPRSREECRYDLVALGEVMLATTPAKGGSATTRAFPGVGGRRRVRRRPGAAPLLRASDGHRHRPG